VVAAALNPLPAVGAHLGGYTPGGDAATWYPRLWRTLVREHGVRSMIDIGAGEGLTVEYFAMLGCEAVGVEGTPQQNERLIQHDYTTGPFDPLSRFDLGWCCEFAEHVEAAYEDNWLATAACCDMLLMTHADPGQGGYHHVNLHYSPYWVRRVEEGTGLTWDEQLTVVTRKLASVNPSPWNHYVRSGLAFGRGAEA